MGPEPKRRAIDIHTTIRKRRAAARKKPTISELACRFLKSGPKAMERNTIPPIQLTAAMTWRKSAANHRMDIMMIGKQDFFVLIAQG